MPTFALATDAEQVARTVRKSPAVVADLSAYTAFLAKLAATIGTNGLPEGTSRWAAVNLEGSETQRGEKRKFTAAAKTLNLNLRVDKDKDNASRFWLLICPKRTRSKNGEAKPKNGKVQKVTAKA